MKNQHKYLLASILWLLGAVLWIIYPRGILSLLCFAGFGVNAVKNFLQYRRCKDAD